MTKSKITTVIFDMDGVISDTQKYHALAESMLLEEYGINMKPDAITKRFAGVSDDEMFKIIFTENKKTLPNIELITKKKWNLMTKLINNVEPIDGAVELITWLYSNNYKLAVASSSPHVFIRKVLNALDVGKYFGSLVSADDVKNGKPAPDIFLKACNDLESQANESVVIEDGQSGITGAITAGMKTIAYNLDSNTADFRISNMIDAKKYM
jgi:HAD superfamily hydrolase (TIGR01509 family)